WRRAGRRPPGSSCSVPSMLILLLQQFRKGAAGSAAARAPAVDGASHLLQVRPHQLPLSLTTESLHRLADDLRHRPTAPAGGILQPRIEFGIKSYASHHPLPAPRHTPPSGAEHPGQKPIGCMTLYLSMSYAASHPRAAGPRIQPNHPAAAADRTSPPAPDPAPAPFAPTGSAPGNSTDIVVPCCHTDRTRIPPPSVRTACFTIARPRPVPRVSGGPPVRASSTW